MRYGGYPLKTIEILRFEIASILTTCLTLYKAIN